MRQLKGRIHLRSDQQFFSFSCTDPDKISSEAKFFKTTPRGISLCTPEEVKYESERLRTFFRSTATLASNLAKKKMIFDNHTSLDDCQKDCFPQWYLVENKDDCFNVHDNRLTVANCIIVSEGELQFKNKSTDYQDLSPSLVDFNSLDEEFLQTTAAAWRKAHPQWQEQKTQFTTRLYLAEFEADLSKKWILLPSREIHETMLYFACSDPTATLRFRLMLPTYQIAVSVTRYHSRDEKSLPPLKFRYLCASVPLFPLKLTSQQIGNQSDPAIDELFKKLIAAALNPTPEFETLYPNAVKFWRTAQEISKLKISLQAKQLKLINLISIYCGTDEMTGPIRGFTVGETKGNNCSTLLGYKLPLGLNKVANVMLDQVGACRHRAYIFVLLCNAMHILNDTLTIPWFLTECEIHTFPTALSTHGNGNQKCHIYKYLGGVPADYKIEPLTIPKAQVKTTPKVKQSENLTPTLFKPKLTEEQKLMEFTLQILTTVAAEFKPYIHTL